MLNTNSTCDTCGGKVTNADGKRKTLPELTALHDQACPGKYRKTSK
jgi:hypothetical protein